MLYTQSKFFREWLQQDLDADMIILTDALCDNIEKVLSVLYSGKVLLSTFEVNSIDYGSIFKICKFEY